MKNSTPKTPPTPGSRNTMHGKRRSIWGMVLFTFMTILLSSQPAKAQVTLFSENFESATNLTTGGWQLLNFGTPVPAQRNIFLVYNACGSEITGKSMETFGYNQTLNQVTCGYFNTPITSTYFTGIRSPLINGVGQSNMKLSYQWRGRGELTSFDFGQFMYSLNGTTWTFFGPILNGATAVQTVSNMALPAALDNTNFYIGWRFVSDFTVANATGLIVDNISVTTCPPHNGIATIVGGTPSICGLGRTTATLAPGTGGATINWYTAPTGGTPVLVNASAVQVDFFTYGSVTYYATSVSSCGSESPTRTAVTFISNPALLVAPSASALSICAGSSTNLSANALRETLFINNTAVAIPDANLAGVNSVIPVSGFNPATLAGNSVLSVRLNIAHTFDSDLEIRLIAPNGSSVILVDNRGGAGANFTNTILDPTPVGAAATPIASGVAPFTGYFVPDNAYSGLTGPLNGNWTLNVSDQVALDAGTLIGWELILRTDANISYSWSSSPSGFTSSAANATATPSGTTTYTVTASDALGSGCLATGSVTVTVNPNPTVSISASGPTTFCGPGCVTLTANPSGGNAPYTYLWSTGATTQSINACATGNYSVTVTSVDGCTGTASQSVTVNTFGAGNLVFTENMGNVSGTVLIPAHEAANGFQNVAFTMSGSGDVRNTQSSAGGYLGASGGANVFLTNNISSPRTFEIAGINTTAFSAMTLSYGVFKSTTASNGSDLVVQVSADGTTYTTLASTLLPTGTGTAVWTTRNSFGSIPSTANLRIRFTNLGASGTQYRIDDVVLAGFSNQAVAMASGPTSFCAGGSVSITASLATSYLWSNGATTQTIVATTSGSYQATLTDANGCTGVTNAVVVTVFPQPSVTASSTNVTCFGAANGTATAVGSGGTAPYSYLWSGGQTTASISGLAPGTYCVNVTDANGCPGSQVVQFSENMGNAPATVSIATHEANNGFQNTAFTMSGSGDVRNTQTSAGGYPGASGGANVFLTNTSVTDFQIAGANSTSFGSYTISFGVFKSTTASNGSDLILEVSTDGITYTALAYPPLGTGTGTAVWTQRSSTGVVPASSNLRIRFRNNGTLGTQYRIDDVALIANTGQACVTITEPPLLTNTLIPMVYQGGWNVSCNGSSDGAIYADVNGGTPAYSFNWSNGGMTQQISGLTAGTYSVTVTDANGCTNVQSITLTEPPLMTDSYTKSTYNCGYNVSCNGATDGSIDYSVTGGTAPYAYLWSNGATTEDLSGLGAGTYSVTATDRNGCTTTETITITEPALLIASVSSPVVGGCGTNISCFGGSNGSATVNVSGGCAPYTYNWSTSGITGTINGLPAGMVSVTVTDANGCQAFASEELTQPAQLTISCPANTTVYQGWPSSACATLTATGISGGCAPYSIAWSNGGSGATITVCPTVSTDYTATVTDANGCTASCTVRVCVVDVRCGNNLQKIEICHNPPGNAQTLCISPNAVQQHLTGHGDHLGACGSVQPCGPNNKGEAVAAVAAQGSDEVQLAAFPNPFSSSTTLKFMAPTDMSISLQVFNMNGQAVANLFDGNAEAGHNYDIDWKANGMSQGIYFVKLVTGSGEVRTLKLVLNR